jgi:hypothetical protein
MPYAGWPRHALALHVIVDQHGPDPCCQTVCARPAVPSGVRWRLLSHSPAANPLRSGLRWGRECVAPTCTGCCLPKVSLRVRGERAADLNAALQDMQVRSQEGVADVAAQKQRLETQLANVRIMFELADLSKEESIERRGELIRLRDGVREIDEWGAVLARAAAFLNDLPAARRAVDSAQRYALARAVAYTADPTREDGQAANGADVIACSLGPNGADCDPTSVLDLAIQFAANQGLGGLGAPIFWAVSNGFAELARDEVCSHPDVIGVGHSNRNNLDDGSAFGPKLEFLAPGVEVYSTDSTPSPAAIN